MQIISPVEREVVHEMSSLSSSCTFLPRALTESKKQADKKMHQLMQHNLHDQRQVSGSYLHYIVQIRSYSHLPL